MSHNTPTKREPYIRDANDRLHDFFTNQNVVYHACRKLHDTWHFHEIELGPGYFDRTFRLSLIHHFHGD